MYSDRICAVRVFAISIEICASPAASVGGGSDGKKGSKQSSYSKNEKGEKGSGSKDKNGRSRWDDGKKGDKKGYVGDWNKW